MRGFILAAGFGTRMRPLTEHIPKAMVPVCGRPLLERAVHFMYKNGITSIGVNAHYLPEQIQKFRDRSPVPFELFIEEGTIRGTGGAFDYARQFFSGDTCFFVLNVDIVCKFDLKAALKKFSDSTSIATLIAFPCEKGKGTILFDRTTMCYCGTPADTLRTPAMGEAAFIGAALYKREFIDFVRREDFSVVPVWKRAVQEGHSVTIDIQHCGFWRDIGNIEALANIHFEQLDNKIDLEIPSNLTCDRSAKYCIPGISGENVPNFTGRYAWIETDQFTGSKVNRSIIWPAVDINGKEITNSIITPYGELPIS